jgi:hypothetical protein
VTASIPLQPAERLILFLAALCEAVYHCPSSRTAGPLLGLLWRRLVRLHTRFAAILARANQPSRLPAAPRTTPRSAPPTPPPLMKKPLGSFAALFRLLPDHNRYRGELEQLLAEPDTAALFQAKPQLHRMVRPLCRLLNLKPPAFPKPPQAPQPEPATPPPGSLIATQTARSPERPPPPTPGPTSSSWHPPPNPPAYAASG